MTADTAVRYVSGWAAAGLHAALGPARDASCGILVYHRVSPAVPGLPAPTLNVTPARFAAQVAGLQERGWTFVSLADLMADRGRAPRRVAVTFDDIYGNVADAAVPILRALGVPATVFVASSFAGAAAPFPFDDWATAHRDALPPDAYRPATPAQLRALRADPLVTIGAHTHTHADFSGRPDAFAADLGVNLRWLRDELGVERPPLAFPYGRTAFGFAGGALTEAALAAGVSGTFTTDGSPLVAGSEPVDWPRITVYDEDSARTLDAKLAGRFAWTLRLAERAGVVLSRR